MAEVIGTIASVLQIIGSISTGLQALRDGIKRVKDAPKFVAQFEDKLKLLKECFTLVDHYVKQRGSRLPHELEFRRVIQELTVNSSSSLRLLQKKLPSSTSKNLVQAFHVWAHEPTITQAMKHIDEYTQYLQLLLQALSLFKSDSVDKRLTEIANILQETAQPRPLEQDEALLECDRKALETIRKVRAFANNTATLVSLRKAGVSDLSSSGFIASSAASYAGSTIVVDPEPSRVRVRREVDFELAEHQKALPILKARGLFESAVKVQRRVFEIQEELVEHHSAPFQDEERCRLKEELADILVECKLESCTEEALSVLRELLNPASAPDDAITDETSTPPSPPSLPTRQDELRIHLKLGQLYKETFCLSRAEHHLRKVFDAYAIETPKDIQKIQKVGEQLLELHTYRFDHGSQDQRTVFIGQLNGFRNELESITGCPLKQRQQCEDALAWCGDQDISVPKVDQDYRFDFKDTDGSSPLHRAAEKCHDEAVISQMLDNSDTLENKDTHGDTPFLVAVRSSNLIAIPLLMQRGCNINARDSEYQTPLHRSPKPAVTKLLLQDRLRRASTFSSEWIEHARRDSSSSSSATTILSPATISSASTLPEQDLDIDAQDAHKKTALYKACEQGQEKNVRLLLLAGANPNIASHDRSPLAAAIETPSIPYQQNPQKRIHIVAALMSRNANVDSVKDLAVLRRPTWIMKEIKKTLKGQGAATFLLSPSSSNIVHEAGRASTGKASEEWSLSSSSTGKVFKLELTDMGPKLLDGCKDLEK